MDKWFLDKMIPDPAFRDLVPEPDPDPEQDPEPTQHDDDEA